MSIDKQVREAVETFATGLRQELDSRAQHLTDALVRIAQDGDAQWRLEVGREVSEARAEAERTLRSSLDSARDEHTREMDQRLSAQRAESSAALKSGVREARVETLSRLLSAVRRLDDAGSLQTILEALAAAAAALTGRAAILLVDGDNLRVWGHLGFPPTATPDGVAVSEVGVLTTAVALRQTSFVKATADDAETSVPAFMRVPVGHTGLVLPVIVGTEVVALVYADDTDQPPEQEDMPIWIEELDVVVRHASLRLETMTSVRTVELLSGPA